MKSVRKVWVVKNTNRTEKIWVPKKTQQETVTGAEGFRRAQKAARMPRHIVSPKCLTIKLIMGVHSWRDMRMKQR